VNAIALCHEHNACQTRGPPAKCSPQTSIIWLSHILLFIKFYCHYFYLVIRPDKSAKLNKRWSFPYTRSEGMLKGGRGMAPLILGTKWKCMVNFASPTLYFRESSPLPVGARGWMGKQPGWTFWWREKLLDRTEIRAPDRQILAKLNTRIISRPCVYICVKN